MRGQANFIKSVVANYWRYKRQCPLVAIETNLKLRPWRGGDRADVLVMTTGKQLVEIEVKTSIEDLKRDANKEIHGDIDKEFNKYPIHAFFFALPEEIEKEAKTIIITEFPHAGILSVGRNSKRYYPEVKITKLPKKFNNPVLGEGQIRQLMKGMSATLCRLLEENNKLKSELYAR